MVRNSAEVSAEREALEDLLKSEGWAVFAHRVEAEWTAAGYFARMSTALASDDPLAPKLIHRTALEMMRMLQWPGDRLAMLRKAVE